MGEYLTADRDNALAGGVFNSRNLQTYHYGGNNPIKYTDPTGKYGANNPHDRRAEEQARSGDNRVIAYAANSPTYNQVKNLKRDSEFYKKEAERHHSAAQGLNLLALAVSKFAPQMAGGLSVIGALEDIQGLYNDIKSGNLSNEEMDNKLAEMEQKISDLENHINTYIDEINQRLDDQEQRLDDQEREIDMLWNVLEQAGLARRPETKPSNNGEG